MQSQNSPSWLGIGLSSFAIGGSVSLVAAAILWAADWIFPRLGLGSTQFLQDLLSVSDPVAFSVLLIVWVIVAALTEIHPIFQSAQTSLAQGLVLVMGYLFTIALTLTLIAWINPTILPPERAPPISSLLVLAVGAALLAWGSGYVNSTSHGRPLVKLSMSFVFVVVLLIFRTKFP